MTRLFPIIHNFRIIGTVLGSFSIENNSGIIGEFFAIGGVAAGERCVVEEWFNCVAQKCLIM